MIHVRTAEELQTIRRCGIINAEVQDAVAESMNPGISTAELDEIALRVMEQAGAKSSITDSVGFPGCICISVNDEVGHGVPGQRTLQDGDVVKIDVSVQYQGYHTDCAITHVVGHASDNTLRLVQIAENALESGIECARPGRRCSDISHAIGQTVQEAGYSVVRKAFGHGIGTTLHEEPAIANFGPANRGPRLRLGMALAIEPVISAGRGLVYQDADGWTDRTVDQALAAHFEDTVILTAKGTEIVTKKGGKPSPKSTSTSARKSTSTPTSASASTSTRKAKRKALTFRPMARGEEVGLFRMAAREMDDILMEAWGRRANPQEIFGDGEAQITVMEQQGQTVGFFSVSQLGDALHLNTLVLARDFQGQGLGQRAMTEVERIARNLHLARVTLGVQTNNARAIGLYRKLGYEGRGEVYVNTLFMVKNVN